MTISYGSNRVERRKFSDDGDGELAVKRKDDVFLWIWDWAPELVNGFFHVSQQVAFVRVYDLSALAYRDIIERWWGDFVEMAAWPSTTQDNDAVYFGNLSWPDEIVIEIDTPTTAGVYGGDAVTWEYLTTAGVWAALTILSDTSDLTGTGAQPFSQSGEVRANRPADLATSTVDGQAAEWIRCRVSTVANLTTVPIFAYTECTEFVSSAAYVDDGVTRTATRLDNNVSAAAVTGVGEFEVTMTSSFGRTLTKVFRFVEPGGAGPSDYR